jgi:hypothetical protein
VTASARTAPDPCELHRFIRDLSNDRVTAVDRSGPVFAAATQMPRTPAPDTFVWALPYRTRHRMGNIRCQYRDSVSHLSVAAVLPDYR